MNLDARTLLVNIKARRDYTGELFGTLEGKHIRQTTVKPVYDGLEERLKVWGAASFAPNSATQEELNDMLDEVVLTLLKLWKLHESRLPSDEGKELYNADWQNLHLALDVIQTVGCVSGRNKYLLAALHVLKQKFSSAQILRLCTQKPDEVMEQIMEKASDHTLVSFTKEVNENNILELLSVLKGMPR